MWGLRKSISTCSKKIFSQNTFSSVHSQVLGSDSSEVVEVKIFKLLPKLGRFVNLDFFIESKSCELAELTTLIDVSGGLSKV